MRRDPLTQELADEIMKLGKQYIPALLPADIPRGKLGTCFDSCTVIALDQKYRYVEGIARDPRDRDNWFLHAWVTDGVYAYDPTWQAFNPEGVEIPVPTIYFGVEMPIEAVARFMMKTKYSSIFANRHRAPDLAAKCYS